MLPKSTKPNLVGLMIHSCDFNFSWALKTNYNNLIIFTFFNANMIFVGKITTSDILPAKNKNLVCALHPGFDNKPRSAFIYDNNANSLAYIPGDKGQYYFMGGLNGSHS